MSTIAKPILKGVLRPRSFRDELVHHLQQDIITGVFQPGQRIVERELIHRFGVSSIPVREALQDLESRGLLVRRLNHGYTVVKLTYGDALRILRQVMRNWRRRYCWKSRLILSVAFNRTTRNWGWLLFLIEWLCAPGSTRAVPERFALSFIVSEFVPAFTGAAVEIVNYFA